MDFAKKQLEKYGWKEGKGLGKNASGINVPIKAQLKFDNAGLGHHVSDEFKNNWWEQYYNNAVRNVTAESSEEGVTLKVKSEELKTNSEQMKTYFKYEHFLKTSKLTNSGIEEFSKPDELCLPVEPAIYQTLNDEELFAACGGRTAHKGARHGLKLNGKLSRIEKQEKVLLKKMKQISLSDSESDLTKKMEKIQNFKQNQFKQKVEKLPEPESSNVTKKRKKRKSVSFNETTLTTYYVKSSEEKCDNIATISSPKISEEDSDLEPQQQAVFSDMSKKERKKLKRKKELMLKNVSEETDLDNNKEDEILFFEKNRLKGGDDISRKERKKLKKKKEYSKHGRDDEKKICVHARHKLNETQKRKLLLDETETNDKKQKDTKEESHKSKKRKNKHQLKEEQKEIKYIMKSLDNVSIVSDTE